MPGDNVSDDSGRKRKLSAILAADAVAFSRLMADDEAATVEMLNEARILFRKGIEAHQGRVIDTAGDSVLAEFVSPVESVAAAVEIQKALAGLNSSLPEKRRLRFRIGVNLGDVIEDAGNIYGDGVNVAARLQELAEPGGLCISGTVFEQIHGKLPLLFKSSGERTVKNIPRPVRVYRLTESAARIPTPWRKASIVWSAAALVAILAVGWLAWWQGAPKNNAANPPISPAQGRPRLAILPLDSISPQAEDAYLAEGMTEELISRLSRINGLDVIARTSVMQYKDSKKGIAAVGQELKVGVVLEGSIRKSGNKIRLTVQLIDVPTQGHLWSQEYDRELKDVLVMQSEVAEQIAHALHIKLLGRTKVASSTPTVDPETYSFYLKGLHHAAKFTPEELRKSIAYFEQALSRSPTDAKSWSGIARAHALLGWWGFATPPESFPRAKAASLKALEIDPNLSHAHISLGMVQFLYDWDWSAARQSYEKAIELSPGSADAHLFHGIWLKAMGKNPQAVVEIIRANELDPLYLMANAELGWVAYFGGRLEEAAQNCRRTLEMDPKYIFALSCLQNATTMMRRADAVALSDKLVDLTSGDPYFLGQRGWAYGMLGMKEQAQRVLDQLREMSRDGPVAAPAIWYVQMGLGDVDATIATMERALQERSPDLAWIRSTPEYDWLRGHPRFQSLLTRMRFPN
jgi:adenylate cyclase